MRKHDLASIAKTAAVTVLLLSASCGEHKQKPSSVNPNGDSELALLMREMTTESLRIRAQVERGEQPTGLRDFTDIHTATPTDSTVKGPLFTAFADAYLASVKKLDGGDSSAVFRYDRMVDQCMNCHTEFCPGPKKRIKKLYVN